jgi:hypothetical protein
MPVILATDLFTFTLPIIALAISFSAFTVAVLNYRRKSSLRVRGTYAITHGIAGEDLYLSSVTLENLKDRAITIFGIYLRVGYHHYIKVEEFEEMPLIIKAYETWHNEYEPIDFYAVSSRKIDMNDLLRQEGLRRKLVLSTGEGKYVVRDFNLIWTPVREHLLANCLTVPVYPMRLFYNGKALGGNVKFIVEIVDKNGEHVTVPIYPGEVGLERFNGVILTKESLENAKALEKYLNAQKKAGKLSCTSFKVVDSETLRSRHRMFDGKERIPAKPHGFFVYYILGPLLYWYDRRNRNKKRKT